MDTTSLNRSGRLIKWKYLRKSSSRIKVLLREISSISLFTYLFGF